MKLNEIKLYDSLLGENEYFNIHTNRFRLFTKEGVEISIRSINGFNFAEIDVIDTVISDYWGYCVGFAVLHIKVDLQIGVNGVQSSHIMGSNYGEPEIGF